MTTPALALGALDLETYCITDVENVLTPALAIYPEIVDANISVTLELLKGEADRWRPHIKTAKLIRVMQRLVERGIRNFKCSTTLEFATVCEAGAGDVLIAYPLVSANARRARQIADRFPKARVSALVENVGQIEPWEESRFGLFIDINPGMDRTGIEQDRIDQIILLAHAIQSQGLEFRGLHYYDGHLSSLALPEREAAAHKGYDQLMEIVSALEQSGIGVDEVITAGTPAFPCTLSYSKFSTASFIHRASPGTIIYGDCASLAQLPAVWGYRPAAVVVSTVVSRPSANRITIDAGHKTVSADAGVPTCTVLGISGLMPLKPSEEHLPIEVPIDAATDSLIPSIGGSLYLLPRHICPTVNNFDHALIVERGRITGVEPVTARGREAPLDFEG